MRLFHLHAMKLMQEHEVVNQTSCRLSASAKLTSSTLIVVRLARRCTFVAPSISCLKWRSTAGASTRGSTGDSGADGRCCCKWWHKLVAHSEKEDCDGADAEPLLECAISRKLTFFTVSSQFAVS